MHRIIDVAVAIGIVIVAVVGSSVVEVVDGNSAVIGVIMWPQSGIRVGIVM